MNLYSTIIVSRKGTFSGVNVPGISIEDAQQWCDDNGLGFLEVDALLVSEIPCKDDYLPDWERKIDYETIRLN